MSEGALLHVRPPWYSSQPSILHKCVNITIGGHDLLVVCPVADASDGGHAMYVEVPNGLHVRFSVSIARFGTCGIYIQQDGVNIAHIGSLCVVVSYLFNCGCMGKQRHLGRQFVERDLLTS